MVMVSEVGNTAWSIRSNTLTLMKDQHDSIMGLKVVFMLRT